MVIDLPLWIPYRDDSECGANVFPRNKMSDGPELERWIDV